MLSPSGYSVRAQVAARRDPMELVAVNVPDVKAAEKYYADVFGMTGRPPLVGLCELNPVDP